MPPVEVRVVWTGGIRTPAGGSAPGDTIPEQDQKIIWSLSGENLGRRSLPWDELKAKTLKRFLTTRKVHTMPEAEMAKFRKAWAPLFADWIKTINAMGVDGKEIAAGRTGCAEPGCRRRGRPAAAGAVPARPL